MDVEEAEESSSSLPIGLPSKEPETVAGAAVAAESGDKDVALSAPPSHTSSAGGGGEGGGGGGEGGGADDDDQGTSPPHRESSAMAVDENVASSSSLESASSPRASTTTSSAAIKIETTTLPFSDSPLLPPASANPKVAPRATLEYGKKKKKDKERALGVLEEDSATGGASSGLPIRRRKSGATVRKRSRTQEIADDYVKAVASMMVPPVAIGRYGNRFDFGGPKGAKSGKSSSVTVDSKEKAEQNDQEPNTSLPIERVNLLGILKNPLRRPSVMERWSPIEVATFEGAIALYGKHFSDVQRCIGSKSTKEVIEFYYVWKMTSHYDEWKTSFENPEDDAKSEDDEETEGGENKCDGADEKGEEGQGKEPDVADCEHQGGEDGTTTGSEVDENGPKEMEEEEEEEEGSKSSSGTSSKGSGGKRTQSEQKRENRASGSDTSRQKGAALKGNADETNASAKKTKDKDEEEQSSAGTAKGKPPSTSKKGKGVASKVSSGGGGAGKNKRKAAAQESTGEASAAVETGAKKAKPSNPTSTSAGKGKNAAPKSKGKVSSGPKSR